jgi:hypothetical protein
MPTPTNPAPTPAGSPLLEQKARALGLSADWFRELLQKAGPLVARIILSLLEHYQPPGPAPAAPLAGAAGPAGPADHALLCDRCLEHLLAATAISLHHRQCCGREEGG